MFAIQHRQNRELWWDGKGWGGCDDKEIYPELGDLPMVILDEDRLPIDRTIHWAIGIVDARYYRPAILGEIAWVRPVLEQ